MKILLVLLTLIHFISLAQNDCTLNLSALIPNYETELDLVENSLIRFKLSENSDSYRYYRYEFVRSATKKELKKPEKIDENLTLIESSLYSTSTINSTGLFLDTGSLAENYFASKNIIPFGLAPVDQNNYLDQDFEVTEINESYIVLKNHDYILISYVSNPSKLFQQAPDQKELLKRKEYANSLVGNKISTDSTLNPKSIKTVHAVEVLPYETKIFTEYNSSVMFISLSNNSDKVLFDYDCLNTEKTRKDSLSKLTIQLVSDYDEFKGRTFYEDKRGSARYDRFKFNLYYSVEDGKSNPDGLRLSISSLYEDWLFIEDMIVIVDGQKFTFETDFDGTVMGGGTVLETFDTAVNSRWYKMLTSIKPDSNVKLRFNGSKFYTEYELHENQKLAIFHLLNHYTEAGGGI